jgi:hypothetical protein
MLDALTSRKVRGRGLIEAVPGAAIAGNLSGDDHPRVIAAASLKRNGHQTH